MGKLLDELDLEFKKCSDCILSKKYIYLLNELLSKELKLEDINYLCEKIVSQKSIWELRFEHLKVLLLNNSSHKFDLKNFYFDNFKKSRRLSMKTFFIRGYAIYANEDELNLAFKKFSVSLEKCRDYIDLEYILSVAGLPYLEQKYGYPCITSTLNIAKTQYLKIDELLRGYFTLDENLNVVQLLSNEEINKRTQAFLKKHQI